MAASIDDSILKEALEFRRSLFFQTLPPGITETSRERNWVAYLFSLSQSSTPSRTNENDAACVKKEHTPPLPAAAPEAKRRRRNLDASQQAHRPSLSQQHSIASNPSRYQDGPSPFINTGTPVPTPVLSQWCNTDIPKQQPAEPNNLQPLAIPQQQSSTAKRTQTIPVREYNPDMFRPSVQTIPINPSAVGQTFNQSPLTPIPSPFLDTSPYSSSSGISFGVSTSPTSAGSIDMTRMDSLGGTSFYNNLKMIRIGSATSKDTTDQANFPKESLTATQQNREYKPRLEGSMQAIGPVHDISQAGAQFSNQNFDGVAANMQRQISSGSRQLHPKPNVSPSMVRTTSSAEGYDVIRVPSSDGSYKEAIKIRRASSFVKTSSSDKVKCPHPGCAAQPQGFKGVHEMQRHFDRAHKQTRQVYVCAPLANDPDFLSKTNCKHCQSQKPYNEDYNAGEHLRRMHFNPKQLKIRRGQLKPEERRGGKGGGTEPCMTTLRNYMVTFKVDMDGIRVSEPKRLNPESNLIMPTITDDSNQLVDQYFSKTAGASSLIDLDSEDSEEEYEYESMPRLRVPSEAKPRFVSNESSDFVPFQLDLAGDMANNMQRVDVNTGVEDQVHFDPNDPLINDPMLFDAIPSDNSAMYNDELVGYLSSFS